jgi:ADP-heptose:LPS heptosyltransferase
VIDFEPNGLKTSLVSWMAAKACDAQTVGIAQFPGRSWFYDKCSPSLPSYALKHGLSLPMDYTHRDFVVLQALGIERKHTAIELRLTPEAEAFKQTLLASWPKGLPVVGLNIGCGTQDALGKRPDLTHLAACFSAWHALMPFALVLSGAPFERDVNQAFLQALSSQSSIPLTVVDLAGKTSLITSAGLIDACDVFVSTDSGPYHMAVGLKKPCLVWFTYSEVTSFHEDPWVQRVINPSVEEFTSAAMKLVSFKNQRGLTA